MNWQKTAVVYKKELVDTLRDRRFLVSAILIPILLFPVMTIGLGFLAGYMVMRTQQKDQRVMVRGGEHAPELMRQFEKVKNLSLVPFEDDYVKQIDGKKVQAAIEFPEGFEKLLRSNPRQKQTIKIFHYEGEIRSRTAVRAVTRAVDDYGKEIAGSRLAAKNLSIELLTPFQYERSNVASAEKVSGNILGMILPYMIILLCLTGAMYPAMDLTAGEKERGTMETILASPAGRVDIVAGKFLLVLTVAMITTAFSIASFAGSVILGSQLLTRMKINFVLVVSGKAIAAVFFLVLPLAILFSAALMAISLYARSYKEAQSYIGPLIFLVILPAMGSFVPGVELNAKMAMVPILNISLLAKEIFAGQFPMNYIAIIFGSTTLYGVAALYVAVRQFHNEEVLFRS
jgi:sodium transport system permease protein